MNNKKQYQKLDEIGFLGSQHRSDAQIKKDSAETSAYFKALKSTNKKTQKKYYPTKNKA